jgi:hypothetical protein
MAAGNTITIAHPRSVQSRHTALLTAKGRYIAAISGDATLTTATSTRLLAMFTSYGNAQNAVTLCLANSITANRNKNTAQRLGVLYISHFFQDLTNCITRGVAGFSKEDRAYYGLDVNSEAGPDCGSEAKLAYWLPKIILGETNRIAAGGTALLSPTIAQVTTFVDDFLTKEGIAANMTSLLATARKALADLAADCDGVIKKVWGEVQTFFNELDETTKRNNSREWGVVYITLGIEKLVTVTVYDSVTHAGIVDADVEIKSTGNNKLTDFTFRAIFNTRIISPDFLIITKDGYDPQTIAVHWLDGIAVNITVNLVAII